MNKPMTDTSELRRKLLFSGTDYALGFELKTALNELDALRAEVANLKELQRREALDWAEAHDLLLAVTGTVVDEAGQPPLIELVGRLVADNTNLGRDALQAKLIAELASHDYGWTHEDKPLGEFVADEWERLTAENRQLREAVEGAIRIQDLWLPNDFAGDEIEEVAALRLMRTRFIQAITKGTDDAPST